MKGNVYQPHTCSLGNMKASTAVLLSCLALILFNFGGFIFCCIVIAIERKSAMVKYNVTLAALVWAAFAVLVGILNIINGTFSFLGYWLVGYSGGFLGGAISLANIIRFIILVVVAVNGNKWQSTHIPVLSNIAEVISHTGAPVMYDGTGPVPPECQTTGYNPAGPQGYNPAAYQGAPQQQWNTPPQQGQPVQPGGQPWPAQPQQPGTGAWAPGQQPQAPQTTTYAPGQPQTPPPGSPYSDPNQQLPPEMRDTAPPKDML